MRRDTTICARRLAGFILAFRHTGFDPNNRLHMMKLITNPRIREKMDRVGKAIREAGIDPAEAKVRRHTDDAARPCVLTIGRRRSWT